MPSQKGSLIRLAHQTNPMPLSPSRTCNESDNWSTGCKYFKTTIRWVRLSFACRVKSLMWGWSNLQPPGACGVRFNSGNLRMCTPSFCSVAKRENSIARENRSIVESPLQSPFDANRREGNLRSTSESRPFWCGCISKTSRPGRDLVASLGVGWVFTLPTEGGPAHCVLVVRPCPFGLQSYLLRRWDWGGCQEGPNTFSENTWSLGMVNQFFAFLVSLRDWSQKAVIPPNPHGDLTVADELTPWCLRPSTQETVFKHRNEATKKER